MIIPSKIAHQQKESHGSWTQTFWTKKSTLWTKKSTLWTSNQFQNYFIISKGSKGRDFNVCEIKSRSQNWFQIFFLIIIQESLGSYGSRPKIVIFVILSRANWSPGIPESVSRSHYLWIVVFVPRSKWMQMSTNIPGKMGPNDVVFRIGSILQHCVTCFVTFSNMF